ncbi:uncharacterized membrane protein YidH (DUF202 family) [Catenuloplanes nepalensis]|uniref:Uncharacterized membrane protein YidH (DUF202 family) n=1 Tax=Catenuloplanes nepalensis TaxID=587533 RepID=A0ABT9N0T4_9ACTN|nr:DUF202 domain-containing protein [Catenuloplanes nepalensis]MDP9797306.1 uncharacterized membrane protein YidH (DUF202 family) [Catenuloplanes nepalensis]
MTQPVHGPGVPIIRTGLAWRRTALSFATVTLLALRLALTSDGGVPVAVACALAALAACTTALVVVRRRVADLQHGRTSLNGHTLLLCAILALGYALIGAVLMIL